MNNFLITRPKVGWSYTSPVFLSSGVSDRTLLGTEKRIGDLSPRNTALFNFGCVNLGSCVWVGKPPPLINVPRSQAGFLLGSYLSSVFSRSLHDLHPGKLTALSLAQAYLTYTASVALGAQIGIEECKFQFAWERWNCPEHAFQFSTHNRLRAGKFSWDHTSLWAGRACVHEMCVRREIGK